MARRDVDLESTLHQEPLDDFVWLRTDEIDEGDRLRQVDTVWAEALGLLMARDGQDTPIVVCRIPGQSRWRLVAGAHRLHGAKSADIDLMRAEIVSADRDGRRMREVRENLFRSDLAPIDRAAHIAEAVSILKRRAGIDPVVDGRVGSAAARWQKVVKDEAADATATMAGAFGFTELAAAELGLSGRTVERNLMLYRRLVPSLVQRLRDARHSVATNASQLAALAKLDEHDQAKVVSLLLVPGASLNYSQPKTVGDAIAHPLGPKPAKQKLSADSKRLATVLNTFQNMTPAELTGLFQLPQFHALLPTEARKLLMPMLRVGAAITGNNDAAIADQPEVGSSGAARLARHGSAPRTRGHDEVRQHGNGLGEGEGQLADGLALARGSRILGSAAEAADQRPQLIALIHDQLSEGLDVDWIITNLSKYGASCKFAHGTYELKLARVTATCTGGGAGLLSAWMNAAERRDAQAVALGLSKASAA